MTKFILKIAAASMMFALASSSAVIAAQQEQQMVIKDECGSITIGGGYSKSGKQKLRLNTNGATYTAGTTPVYTSKNAMKDDLEKGDLTTIDTMAGPIFSIKGTGIISSSENAKNSAGVELSFLRLKSKDYDKAATTHGMKRSDTSLMGVVEHSHKFGDVLSLKAGLGAGIAYVKNENIKFASVAQTAGGKLIVDSASTPAASNITNTTIDANSKISGAAAKAQVSAGLSADITPNFSLNLNYTASISSQPKAGKITTYIASAVGDAAKRDTIKDVRAQFKPSLNHAVTFAVEGKF